MFVRVVRKKSALCLNGRSACDILSMCRQVVLPVGLIRIKIAYKCEGGDHMTDYEMIMVFLTFLVVLLAVDKKNNG